MREKVIFADQLRGLAALSVVVSHYLGFYWTAPPIVSLLTGLDVHPGPEPWFCAINRIPFFDWGTFGVALFFLISGFVIPFSFDRLGALGFLINRAFRLYPTYWVGLTISFFAVALGCWLTGRIFPHTILDVLWGYGIGLRDFSPRLTSIDGVSWSLEIELKFYLLCALAAGWLRKKSLKTFLIPVVLAIAAVAVGAAASPAQAWVVVFTLSAPSLIFMFAGVAFHFGHVGRITRKTAFLLATCIFMMFALSHWFGLFKQMAVVPSYGIAFVAFVFAQKYEDIIERVRGLAFLSKISYPLYVTHGVAGLVALNLLLSSGLTPIISIALIFPAAVAVAYLLHVTVETRSHNMGRYLGASVSDGNAGSLPLTIKSQLKS